MRARGRGAGCQGACWGSRCSPHSPERALQAHHAQLLRAVNELALELHVLQHCRDVGPVVLCHRPADGQVVAVPWKKSQPLSIILGSGALGWSDAQLSSGLIFVSGC